MAHAETTSQFDQKIGSLENFLEWKDNTDSKVVLAKIILFDQFPRSIYRGTKDAFKFDDQACILSALAYDKG